MLEVRDGQAVSQHGHQGRVQWGCQNQGLPSGVSTGVSTCSANRWKTCIDCICRVAEKLTKQNRFAQGFNHLLFIFTIFRWYVGCIISKQFKTRFVQHHVRAAIKCGDTSRAILKGWMICEYVLAHHINTRHISWCIGHAHAWRYVTGRLPRIRCRGPWFGPGIRRAAYL